MPEPLPPVPQDVEVVTRPVLVMMRHGEPLDVSAVIKRFCTTVEVGAAEAVDDNSPTPRMRPRKIVARFIFCIEQSEFGLPLTYFEHRRLT